MFNFSFHSQRHHLPKSSSHETAAHNYVSFANIMAHQDDLIITLAAYCYYKDLKETTHLPAENYEKILKILLISIKSAVHEIYGISAEDFNCYQDIILQYLEQHSLKNGCTLDVKLPDVVAAYKNNQYQRRS